LETMANGGKLVANLGAYLLAGESAKKIAPEMVNALDRKMAERLNPTQPSVWEDRGLSYSGGGVVDYDVNDVVQLKNIPENYPYEIRNGIVDNKWKIVRVSKSGRSMNGDIMKDIFGYDIELLDTKMKYKAFVYPNEVKSYIKYSDGGGVPYKYPKYNMPIHGTYLFRTATETFELQVYMSERRNDTEDSLVVEEVKNSNVQLGSIIVKNSALNRLTKGLRVKAKSSIGNYSGTIEKISDN